MSYDIYNYTADTLNNKYGFSIGSNCLGSAKTDVWLSPDTRLEDTGADAFALTGHDAVFTLLWAPRHGFAIHNYYSDPEVQYVPLGAIQLLRPDISEIPLETVADLIKAIDEIGKLFEE